MPVYEEKEKVDGKTRYFIRTYVEDINGKKKQITKHNKNWIGRNGKLEAQEEEIRLKNRRLDFIEDITLSILIDKFLEYKKPMVKFSTYQKIEQDINYYILVHFPTYKKITTITTRDILNWQNELNKLELSISTKKRTHTTFCSIMKYGCTFYDLEKNVVQLVDNFKVAKSEAKKEMNFLTLDEFDKFISFEENDLYKAFFTILFYKGMRRGELLALCAKDVDFKANTITINKTFNPKYKIGDTSPKTQKSNRKIQMVNIVRDIFKSLSTNDIESKFFDKITLTTLKRKCDINCEKANIDKTIRIHDFRHSFASMCIEKNVPIAIISSYLGHENISITLDVYSHLYPNSQNKLIDILN